MGFEEKDLKKYINNGLADINLTEVQKHRMQTLLREELQLGRQGLLPRVVTRFHRFLNTTYEISLGPVLAFSGVLIIGLVLMGGALFPDNPQMKAPVEEIYRQQVVSGPDGNARVVYIPVYRGGI